MDNVTAAKKLIGLMDLTALNSDDNSGRIEKLCGKAFTPYGNVAAVCIWPRFVPLAKKLLQQSGVKTATVINFPQGGTDTAELAKELKIALDNGADEIDAVLPYRALMNGESAACEKFFRTLKEECPVDIPVKIIIESGELIKPSLISEACRMCIDSSAAFIKTSTGKTPVSATPEAANLILENISSGRRNIGFKASGGIKTTEDAKKYLILAEAVMGDKWVSPQNFRIGASSLLDDLLQTIERGY